MPDKTDILSKNESKPSQRESENLTDQPRIPNESQEKPNLLNVKLEEKSIKMDLNSVNAREGKTPIRTLNDSKSEHDKEDYISLENIFDQKDSCEDNIPLIDDFKDQTPKFFEKEVNEKLPKISSKSLLSQKDQNKLKNTKTRWGSDIRTPSGEHKDEIENYKQKSEVECAVMLSPKSQNTKNSTAGHEMISFQSEEKYGSKVPIMNIITYQTSESSSIKCSSVTSNAESKMPKEPQMKEEIKKNLDYQNDEWITPANGFRYLLILFPKLFTSTSKMLS